MMAISNTRSKTPVTAVIQPITEGARTAAAIGAITKIAIWNSIPPTRWVRTRRAFNAAQNRWYQGKRVRNSWWRSTFGRRSEEHTSELQSRFELVCRLLLENKQLNA